MTGAAVEGKPRPAKSLLCHARVGDSGQHFPLSAAVTAQNVQEERLGEEKAHGNRYGRGRASAVFGASGKGGEGRLAGAGTTLLRSLALEANTPK